MKMRLTFVLLLFLGVGGLTRSSTLALPKAEVAANELSERFTRSASGESTEVAAGGKSKESDEDGGGISGRYVSAFKHLASILGVNGISHVPEFVSKYYSGSLPVSVESLLKTVGITSSLSDLQDTSQLYQMMKSVPLVGTIVNFLTNSLSIPINIIALIFSLATTAMQHMYSSIPKVF